MDKNDWFLVQHYVDDDETYLANSWANKLQVQRLLRNQSINYIYTGSIQTDFCLGILDQSITLEFSKRVISGLPKI